MNPEDYESILRAEFDAEDGSFLIQLRCDLTWDRAAFSRLVAAMEACAGQHEGCSTLPRWIAEGFWYCSHFIADWSSHPSFPREHPPEYYEAAYERLHDLAFWFFFGQHPLTKPFSPLPGA